MSVAVLPGVFTVPQAARHVGVTAKTLRKEIQAGRIRVRYIGRCVRILDEDLAAWLRSDRSFAGRAASSTAKPDEVDPIPSPGSSAGESLEELAS